MNGPPLTIGVEEEFHVVDPDTRTLSNDGDKVLLEVEDIGDNRFEAEIKQSMVETATAVCSTLDEVRSNLTLLRGELVAGAARAGRAVAASGTAPLGHWRDGVLTPDERYARIVDLHQQVVWEQVVCGCHVHIGFEDRALAVEVLNRVRPWLSTLLALSASSPYWLNHDTGYASYRTTVWWRWPTAHIPAMFSSTAEYDEVVQTLVDTGTVVDDGQIYWDVRLSRKQRTLEFRVADTCTTVDEAVLHAALCRALATVARDDALAGRPVPSIRPELLRAAKWRAARFGVTEMLIDPLQRETVPAAEAVARLLDHCRPALEAYGDDEQVRDTAQGVLEGGTSSDRQRHALAKSGRLEDVVDLLLAQTRPT
ncbi:MAG TPA: glutamate--cysteine ligase [Egibacteraceae bacterium]|nr:glutamate--cysteine ligase [Egibacteraceae bacterium]